MVTKEILKLHKLWDKNVIPILQNEDATKEELLRARAFITGFLIHKYREYGSTYDAQDCEKHVGRIDAVLAEISHEKEAADILINMKHSVATPSIST